MHLDIYPFLLNREEITTENSGYPKEGSHIFMAQVENRRYLLEIYESKIQEKYPEMTPEKLEYIVQNIVRLSQQTL